MAKLVGVVIRDVEASNELERGDWANISLVAQLKFDAKVMLKHIFVGCGVERRANVVNRVHLRTGLDRLVGTSIV